MLGMQRVTTLVPTTRLAWAITPKMKGQLQDIKGRTQQICDRNSWCRLGDSGNVHCHHDSLDYCKPCPFNNDQRSPADIKPRVPKERVKLNIFQQKQVSEIDQPPCAYVSQFGVRFCCLLVCAHIGFLVDQDCPFCWVSSGNMAQKKARVFYMNATS